ncbi:MAG: lasso peptide biosynthesis B2 protein [Chloroflexota bacterium]|nr:lasso peptide biosynthesis B2 protein [Chloroflexota bacterium]
MQLLVETTFWLLLSRLAILVLPFRWVMRSCGTQHALSPESIPEEQIPIVEHITWAIDAVRWATPWDSNCLARSIASKRLLRRRGLSSTLYLGVSKSDPRTIIAHAWLRCGEVYITGTPGHEDFTVVTTFAEV